MLSKNESHCADDTLIYISLTVGESGPVESVCHWFQQVSEWIQNNFLKQKADMTEIILFGLE